MEGEQWRLFRDLVTKLKLKIAERNPAPLSRGIYPAKIFYLPTRYFLQHSTKIYITALGIKMQKDGIEAANKKGLEAFMEGYLPPRYLPPFSTP